MLNSIFDELKEVKYINPNLNRPPPPPVGFPLITHKR